jgi:hypothetical protein
MVVVEEETVVQRQEARSYTSSQQGPSGVFGCRHQLLFYNVEKAVLAVAFLSDEVREGALLQQLARIAVPAFALLHAPRRSICSPYMCHSASHLYAVPRGTCCYLHSSVANTNLRRLRESYALKKRVHFKEVV